MCLENKYNGRRTAARRQTAQGMSDIDVTILSVLFGLAALFIVVHKFLGIFGLIGALFDNGHEPEYRNEAIIEMRSGTLLAFDFTSTSAVYQIPDFAPGYYKLSLEAVHIAQAAPPAGDLPGIVVDSGAIFLVDAESVEDLLAIEARLFHKRDGCPGIIAQYDKAARRLGLRFDYLSVDNGIYSLDFSKLVKLARGAK